MARQDRVEKGYKKAKKVIDRMLGTKKINDVKELVKITDKLTLEILCERAEYGDDRGAAYGVEVYAIKNGQAVDVATMTINNNLEQDIKYLLNCYI